jgi:hypothetical protein
MKTGHEVATRNKKSESWHCVSVTGAFIEVEDRRKTTRWQAGPLLSLADTPPTWLNVRNTNVDPTGTPLGVGELAANRIGAQH